MWLLTTSVNGTLFPYRAACKRIDTQIWICVLTGLSSRLIPPLWTKPEPACRLSHSGESGVCGHAPCHTCDLNQMLVFLVTCSYHQHLVAQLIERRTQDSVTWGSNPVTWKEHKQKFVRVFPSKKCWADSLSVCPTPVCKCTHKNDHDSS